MEKDDVKNLIEQACSSLYVENPILIKNRTHERTIVSHLANYLKPLFPDWNIDTDYNRDGDNGKSKQSIDGELLLPDIIIHNRGVEQGPNLVAIQVKGFWNKEDRTKDEKDLRKLKAKYKYLFLYRLELNIDNFDLILVQ